MLTMLAIFLLGAVCSAAIVTVFARHYITTYTVPMDDYLAAQDYCATVEHERDTLARCLDSMR